jgi:hypothetical protein
MDHARYNPEFIKPTISIPKLTYLEIPNPSCFMRLGKFSSDLITSGLTKNP